MHMKNMLLHLLMLSTSFLFAQKNYQIFQPNLTRNVIIYTPRNFNPNENLPLVINMHGFLTTNSFQMDYTKFNNTADTARCIVAYPQGKDLRWNSGTFFGVPSAADDVGFLADVMDLSAVLFNTNLRKVYAAGYSAGGFMCYKLACDLTNRVAAISPNVASMLFDNLATCVPARPMPICAFNGSADPITAYNGIPFNFPGIDSVKHFWQIKNNCDQIPVTDTLPDLQNDGTRVVRYTYTNCTNATQQVFYKVLNGGHTWPGADDVFLGLIGKTTRDIDMNNTAWNFFKTKEIPIQLVCDVPQNLQAVFVSVDSVQVSWEAIAGVNTYRVALVDDSDRVHFFETNGNEMGLTLNPAKRYKWNVASVCSSGFHNWTTTQNLNQLPTSLKNVSNQILHVFPNPATDVLHIDLRQNQIKSAQVIIYDEVGKVVYQEEKSLVNTLDISFLAAGNYFLEIKSLSDLYIAKFIKS